MVDDAERRFNNLFDRLNNEEVNEAVIALLLDIAQGIGADICSNNLSFTCSFKAYHLEISMRSVTQYFEG